MTRLILLLVRWFARLRPDDARFTLLTALARILCPRYRMKWPQMAWWEHARFSAYLLRWNEGEGLNADRRWMISQLLRLVDGVEGDTAECGVLHGTTSHLILSYNRDHSPKPRSHFAFDSFAGLSAPGVQDGAYWTKGDLTVGIDAVRKNLEGFPGLTCMPGWIPDRFPEVAERRFAFVHIDVDLHDPTRDSVAFFYEHLSPGGILVCDDYGFTTCPGATQAIDDFLADKPERMVSLSGGGGFLIRGTRTSPRNPLDPPAA